MQDLKKQEAFELEILEGLNSKRLLGNLIFTGGTMLRLCYNLDRYSVDLDFWVIKEIDFIKLFSDIKKFLSENYKITDSENKRNTLLFEIRSPKYPRALKIEIRKEPKKISVERSIAYSRNNNNQVMVKNVSLKDMMAAKINAFLNRLEIRDVYDIEFLFKKGVKIIADKYTLQKLLIEIDKLTEKDYSVKLGSLIGPEQRKYYREKNFTILKLHINELIGE